VTYVEIGTAAGHRITINPKRQRTLIGSFVDGMLAESRFVKERLLSYSTYRARGGQKNTGTSSISITLTVRKQLDRLDNETFGKLDAGILALKRKPTPAGSNPSITGGSWWILGGSRLEVFLSFAQSVKTSLGNALNVKGLVCLAVRIKKNRVANSLLLNKRPDLLRAIVRNSQNQ
jgi:hypothetical protein